MLGRGRAALASRRGTSIERRRNQGVAPPAAQGFHRVPHPVRDPRRRGLHLRPPPARADQPARHPRSRRGGRRHERAPRRLRQPGPGHRRPGRDDREGPGQRPAQRHDHGAARRPPPEEGGHLLDPPRPLRADRGHRLLRPGQHVVLRRRGGGPHRHGGERPRIPHQPLRRGRLRRLPRHRQRGRRRQGVLPVAGAGRGRGPVHRRPRMRRARRRRGAGLRPQPQLRDLRGGRVADRSHRRPGPHPAPAGLHPPHAAQGGVVRVEQPPHPQPPHRHRRARRHPRRRR